ncbi:MAG TPA: amino acid racemase [Candidatus Binataceae bacterium]|jgi:aspartate racemase|nr:amino acid racemase [Candidatus Binataceae bacterium]
MKHIGIVAVSSEGAALCYRTICLEGEALMGRHAYPETSLHNLPLADYQRLIERGRWREVGDLLLQSAARLVSAGAQILICPDNTVHQGLDLVHDQSPAPWIHIGEVVAREAVRRGFRRVGVLGTRYLMEGPVYPAKLAAAGIEFRIPGAERREGINRIIFEELVRARFLPSSLAYFREVIEAFEAEGCDAVALACTEIPLLVSESDSRLPVLDSTRLLARAALREALS